jgi:hypothetical protein
VNVNLQWQYHLVIQCDPPTLVIQLSKETLINYKGYKLDKQAKFFRMESRSSDCDSASWVIFMMEAKVAGTVRLCFSKLGDLYDGVQKPHKCRQIVLL